MKIYTSEEYSTKELISRIDIKNPPKCVKGFSKCVAMATLGYRLLTTDEADEAKKISSFFTEVLQYEGRGSKPLHRHSLCYLLHERTIMSNDASVVLHDFMQDEKNKDTVSRAMRILEERTLVSTLQ